MFTSQANKQIFLNELTMYMITNSNDSDNYNVLKQYILNRMDINMQKTGLIDININPDLRTTDQMTQEQKINDIICLSKEIGLSKMISKRKKNYFLSLKIYLV